MALRFRVISADDHVQEPADLWTSRLPKALGDKVPHISRQPDGAERWMIEGKVVEDRRLSATGALAERRYEDAQRWDQVPREAYDPAARKKAMDKDGVDVQVLYPLAAGLGGEAFAAIQDAALQEACVRAYNDWMLETWGKDSRFVPQCLLPFASIEGAKKEAERAVKAGHRGIVMPAFPWRLRKGLPHVHDAKWDPLWATIQDLGVPVCFHSGTDQDLLLNVYPGYTPPVSAAFERVRRPVSNAVAVASFLLGGIPERFPRMKAVFSASSADWVTFQIENCDHEWRTSMLTKEGIPKPSEVFHRQCWVTTWFDKAGFNQLRFLGADNILWESEFPLGTSTYPKSADFIKRNLDGVSQANRDKILFGNAAKLYRVET